MGFITIFESTTICRRICFGVTFFQPPQTASRKPKQNQQGCRFVPKQHFRKQTATDGTKLDLNVGETTRVWRRKNGPNLP